MYTEYAAKHATVRALEVTPVGSSERLFVVDQVGVIDAATFGALYERPAAANGNTHARRAVNAVTKRKRRAVIAQEEKRAAEPVVAPEPTHREPAHRKPTLGDHIVACLQKHGPLTSADVFDRVIKSGVATTSGSVYQSCRDLRDAGRIESRTDEDGDGRMKWFVRG